MMAFRRQSDHPGWQVFSAFGFLFMVAAFALMWTGRISEPFGFGWALLGALMLRPDYVVDLVRAWRKPGEP